MSHDLKSDDEIHLSVQTGSGVTATDWETLNITGSVRQSGNLYIEGASQQGKDIIKTRKWILTDIEYIRISSSHQCPSSPFSSKSPFQ